MDPAKPDNDRQREHLLNSSEHSVSVLTFPAFLETEQRLKPKDGRTALSLGSNGLAEGRIGRWNYTVVPWED